MNDFSRIGQKNIFKKKVVNKEYNYHKTTLLDSLIKNRKDSYNPRTRQTPEHYVGIVLKRMGTHPIPQDHILNSYYEGIEQNAQLVHIKVRIPELHIAYPVPKSLNDAVIALYPTFVADKTTLKEPAEYSLVTVKFLDPENFLYPVFTDIFEAGDSKLLIAELKKASDSSTKEYFDQDPCKPKIETKGDPMGSKVVKSKPFSVKTVEENGLAENRILYNNTQFDIDWDDFVLSDKWLMPTNFRTPRNARTPSNIVLHWTGGPSKNVNAVRNAFIKRNVSSHFLIDYTGTIFQMLDINNIAYHAGSFNRTSIGIDFLAHVDIKEQETYTKLYGPRPVWKWRGKRKHLGFYDIQVEAAKKLIDALCNKFGIPKNFAPNTEQYNPAYKAKTFKGIVGHYHVQNGKWDPGGLDLERLK